MNIIKKIIFLLLSLLGLNSSIEAREVSIEEQIKILADLGLELNKSVSVEDLLYSWDREDYESKPFDTILFVYGSEIESEPWGRNICDRVWNFDVEFIEGNGSYTEIVNRFSLVAGVSEKISEVKDMVDFETGEAWVTYKLDGEARKYDIVIDNDWADPDAVAAIMGDMAKPGYEFYYIDNGQASLWFYLTETNARELKKLSKNSLKKS